MKWHKGKIVDMNLKENQDAWRQRLFVSFIASIAFRYTIHKLTRNIFRAFNEPSRVKNFQKLKRLLIRISS